METQLAELRRRHLDAGDLQNVSRLLGWDQATYMPAGGAAARGRQMATVGRLAHEMFTDPAIGRLLDELRPYEHGLPADSDDARLIRVARLDYERAVNVPASFMDELTRHQAAGYQAWTVARPANDFATMQPYLERTLELSRQLAPFFPGYEHIADPLIDFADYGMSVSTLRPLFAQLRERLVPMAQAIAAAPPVDDSFLYQRFPKDEQLSFAASVIKEFGYDFDRGRSDLTHHPFMTCFSIGDVRITTRADDDHLGDGLFATMHEAGHAMYHQGIDWALEGTSLEYGASGGVHESQSRLWENLVGRSRSFWEHRYPQLQAAFPRQLGSVPLDSFYRAINKVQPSLIRVAADEVTYNLHVMIRFDLELDLLEGKLAVRDQPEAWRERYRTDLGIVPPDDRDGALQDMHWYGGVIGGAFQSYTLGNIMSALFFSAATRARPEILDDLRAGRFATLHAWLAENIYRHGRKYTAAELVERTTGEPLTIEPYIAYLRAKFGELYAL